MSPLRHGPGGRRNYRKVTEEDHQRKAGEIGRELFKKVRTDLDVDAASRVVEIDGTEYRISVEIVL